MMSTKRYEIANLSRDSIHLLGDALNNYLHFSFDRPRDLDLEEEVTLEVVLDHLGEAMRVIDEAQGVVAIGPLAVAAEMDGEFRLGMSDDALSLVHRALEYVSTNLPDRCFRNPCRSAAIAFTRPRKTACSGERGDFRAIRWRARNRHPNRWAR
jgi:hypothetical protein